MNEERKRRRMAEEETLSTRYVKRPGHAWIGMQANVPRADLAGRGLEWDEERARVVRNSVAAHAERLLEVLVKVTAAAEECVDLRDDNFPAVAMAQDLLEELPEPLNQSGKG